MKNDYIYLCFLIGVCADSIDKQTGVNAKRHERERRRACAAYKKAQLKKAYYVFDRFHGHTLQINIQHFSHMHAYGTEKPCSLPLA